jgi:predicted DNA-binding protein
MAISIADVRGAVMVENKDSVLSVRFPLEVVEQMRTAAEQQGVTVSEWIRQVTERKIERALQPMDTKSRLNRVLNAFAPFVIMVENNEPYGRWTKKLNYAYEDLLEMLEEAKRANEGEGTEQPQRG